MSVALRHPETEEPQISTRELRTRETALAEPASRAVRESRGEPMRGEESPLEWREVSAHIQTFTGATPEDERIERQIQRRAHKRFFLSSTFVAGTLLFAQLLGLIYLYGLELQTLRQDARVEREISRAQLDISLAQSQLAATKSDAELAQWSGQLGYRKAQILEMDDVTSRARFVPPAENSAEERVR